MKSALAVLTLALLASPTLAQTHAHGAANTQSPYAGMTNREIKALSNEQITDLRAGRGMSLALPAELNGYPGPGHALELAEQLDLTLAQHVASQALFGEMKREATSLGGRIIESERALDTLFAARTVNSENLNAATADAAALQGQLRALHLKYHLHMRDVLTPTQVARYNELRGYKKVNRP